MEVTILRAEPRTALGKKRVAMLRESGKVPCVLYGGDGEARPLELDAVDVSRELRKHHRVFKLQVDGKVEGVYLQHAQFGVMTDDPMHLDFKRIDLDRTIKVDVELSFVGHPAGASKGGRLVKDVTHLEIEALPHAVPYELEVHIGDLDIGGDIRASAIKLPQGVTFVGDPSNVVVCHMTLQVEAPPPPPPTAPAEGAEGAAAAPKAEE
jgi:large subunit ribosomal protein L25